MKKRFLSIFLAVCMVMTMVPTFALPAAAQTSELIIDSSLNSDNEALVTTNTSTTGLYYAIMGKNGAVVPKKTSGTAAAVNGWYQASSSKGVSFSGIDPSLMPFQIVTSTTTASQPGGTATAVTNGTALGNRIYYYYVANTDTTDGFATVGSDTYGNGTIQSPYQTAIYAAAKIGSVEQKNQGVIVLLDDTKLTNLLQFPAIADPSNPKPEEKLSQNITITSNGAQHTIYRAFGNSEFPNTTLELCNKSRATLDNVAIDGQKQRNNYGEIYLDRNTTFVMRGNSKICNGSNRGVEIRSGATFIMESGEISGNTAGSNPTHWSDGYTPIPNAGGGVYICAKAGTPGGVFIMKGGKITGNTASAGAAGVFGEAGATIKISGDSVITGNTKIGTSSNIYLNNNQTITLTEPLSDKANLGVYVTNMPSEGDPDVAIATGDGTYVPTASDVRAFSSDQATTAGVILKSNQIVMSNEAKAQAVTVSGKVSDYVGGKTILSGITVQLYDAEDTTFARSLGSAITDVNGDYALNATVKQGNYVVHIAEKANAYNETSTAITVGTTSVSNVNLTLVKYSKASVALNKPIFNNDQSGYSFKSATINNFTGVKSITFSITKGTTAQSIPTFLTPTSKLESIDGDTRTFTYVFANSVTVSQAEEFIRGIVFNYVAGADISVTVDNNATKLPDGAKITKSAHPDGTDHYYMYVPSNFISWTQAYNLAKTYSYMGMKGYLTTVTSQEEDKALTNISTISAWSAGTRYLNADNSKLADPSSVSILSKAANYYYWACGPEAGKIYYNSTSPTPLPGAGYTGYNGAYNNWGANPKQPDANTTNEICMQVNWPYDTGASGQMRWNDLPNGGLPNIDLVKGYFVEFSNYAGGMESSYASDKTAVGTFNLATGGGVEEVATVTLNAPVYGSNKSVFSFGNAEVKNISAIYSLTVKLDNYTNVLSKPSAPAVSNELSNIAGAANTIIYQFKSGITLADAQSFLRGLKFRYGGLKNSSTTNVSVTVDGNKSNLPTGASITEYNGHYYMYVNDYLSWTDAYNKAKTYNYMGLIGYLATITSAGEDKMLDNISMNGAWSAGTRHTGTYDLATAPNGTSVNNPYFIWACGPEAGTKYYYNNTTPVNGAYNGFFDTNEPNGFINAVNAECCMQVHYKGNSSSPITWNDLSDRIYSGGLEPKVGYFVEFSDYDGGRVDGFTQSANGKSMVPISVEKGDVFNTVKEGGTYYVDTVLKAFDRNITNITVNNNAFTNGGKLPGNLNTTYTIKATDLEGSTATMTVTMKTIASLSQPISGLTVNNVQMSNKDSILAVKAALTAIDTTDASAAQKTEIANAIQNCKNLYFALFNAAATAANGTNGWYKNGVGDITLTAPTGFEISTSNTGTWANSITVDKSDGANKTAAYYLKETSTGDISGAKTFSYKVDTAAPTGTITIKNNAFKNFIHTISFGLFFKNSVDVSIIGTDTLSTPVTISYQKVASDGSYNENGTWTNGSSFSVTANEKFFVYAKLTDSAGNVAIINSEGVVVYTDSTQGTATISFTKASTVDATATVNLNGNTINEIKNGAVILASGTDYTVSNGTITFKANYLDSLAVGTYTLTVSYNPMGETYENEINNQAPATTSLTLSVKARNISGEAGSDGAASVTINPESMVYNGNAFNPAVIVKDGAKTLTAGTDYTVSWPSDMTNVGEKALTVTFKGNYSGAVTKKAAITNAAITDTTNKTQSAIYNKNAQTVATPTGTTVNNQPITVKYSMDGGTTYTLTSAPQITSTGSYTVSYQLSAPNHNAVTGKIVFTIHAATDNAIRNLALNGWTFGNSANAPTATATYGTPVFTYSDSENGTYTSTVPAKAGTYWVKASVNATADYNACEAKISFVISNKAIDGKDIAISGVNAYYLFTGSAITPEPTVTVNGTVLVKDTDYTVSYENNTEIGKTAKVKVVLKGNYSGSAAKTFEIKYGTASEDEIGNMISIPDYNSKGWHKEDIILSAKGGFTLSAMPTGSFGSTLTISKESAKTGTDYTFYIKAADGSVYKKTLPYKLDKTAPTGSVTIGPGGIKNFLSSISFGLLFNSDVDVTVASDDALSGIDKVQVYKSDKELTEKELSSVEWTDYTAAVKEIAKDKESFIYYARITDHAGNIVTVNSEGATFDLTAPVISGVTNGETYYTTQKITITDSALGTVTVNGKDFKSGDTIFGNSNETYKIVAADKAGNSTTYTIIMKPIDDISNSLSHINAENVKPEDQNEIENIKKKAEAVDTANATPEEKTKIKVIIDRCNLLLKKIADNSKPNSPQTGDNNNMFLWLAVLSVSGGVLTSLSINKKRRKANGN